MPFLRDSSTRQRLVLGTLLVLFRWNNDNIFFCSHLVVHVHGFSFVFSLQLEMDANKFYNNTVMDLGVSILENVKVQSLEDFTSHQKLELWETLFLCEFKLEGGILQNKTWQQQTIGDEAQKCVIYT